MLHNNTTQRHDVTRQHHGMRQKTNKQWSSTIKQHSDKIKTTMIANKSMQQSHETIKNKTKKKHKMFRTNGNAVTHGM